MEKRIRIPHNWEPRFYQLPVLEYFDNGGKRAVTVWHRRSGKDECALHHACRSAHEKVATYWHMLPEATQARKAIWSAVNPHTGMRRIDEAFPVELRENTNDHEMFIRFKNGSTWQVVGSDNFNSLMGSPPYGIVFSEWSLANPSAWPYIRPILRENKGWAWFLYTPRGKNHGYKTLNLAKEEDDWFAQVLTARDTKVFSGFELDKERKELIQEYGEEQGEAIFNQEYLCSFDAAILGAYYGREMMTLEQRGRVSLVAHDPALKVYTAWDLGIDDSTAIWFAQVNGAEVRLIDYYENSGCGLEHYAGILKSKPYLYEDHLLPHDVQVRELGSGRSRRETLEGYGIPVTAVEQGRIEDGINASRLLLQKCWFDSKKCENGIEAMKQYQREWDDKSKTFRNRPKHDWTSHCADAFRTLAVGLPVRQITVQPYYQQQSFLSHSPQGWMGR